MTLLRELRQIEKENSLVRFFNDHGILTRDFKNWRMLPEEKRRVGEINGLSKFRGTVYATNGILCAIVDDTGTCQIGHIDWFVNDKKTKSGKPARPTESEQLARLIKTLCTAT